MFVNPIQWAFKANRLPCLIRTCGYVSRGSGGLNFTADSSSCQKFCRRRICRDRKIFSRTIIKIIVWTHNLDIFASIVSFSNFSFWISKKQRKGCCGKIYDWKIAGDDGLIRKLWKYIITQSMLIWLVLQTKISRQFIIIEWMRKRVLLSECVSILVSIINKCIGIFNICLNVLFVYIKSYTIFGKPWGHLMHL